MTETVYTAAECLARAEQCRREADRATYEAQRYQLLWLADQWRDMAQLALRVAATDRSVH